MSSVVKGCREKKKHKNNSEQWVDGEMLRIQEQHGRKVFKLQWQWKSIFLTILCYNFWLTKSEFIIVLLIIICIYLLFLVMQVIIAKKMVIIKSLPSISYKLRRMLFCLLVTRRCSNKKKDKGTDFSIYTDKPFCSHIYVFQTFLDNNVQSLKPVPV